MNKEIIVINFISWLRLVFKLRKQGKGSRESGAFLLASKDSRKVVRIAYYVDLDPDCLNKGFIEFSSSGYSKLWKICREEGLQVIADIHTHPGGNVSQSELDKAHPMISRDGHIGMIMPNYASALFTNRKRIGFYKYCTYFWKELAASSHLKFALI